MIVSYASWHFVFMAGAPFALVALIAGRALPDPDSVAHQFDKGGAALCAATFGLLISGSCQTASPQPCWEPQASASPPLAFGLIARCAER